MSKFIDDVVHDINESKTNIVAYLDFKKAFDTINHEVLMRKLEHCGIGESLLKLLRNYLMCRKQKVKPFNNTSGLNEVKIGVPQGSIIVYINDLPKVLKDAKCLMYADDTVIYYGHKNVKKARKTLQADLCKVHNWCAANRLTLNVQKTKFMTFMSDHKRKNNTNEFRLFMKGNPLEEVENYKYLGTDIDNKLNGDTQFTKLLKTVGLRIRTFGKIRRFLTEKSALTVYKSTILY